MSRMSFYLIIFDQKFIELFIKSSHSSIFHFVYRYPVVTFSIKLTDYDVVVVFFVNKEEMYVSCLQLTLK